MHTQAFKERNFNEENIINTTTHNMLLHVTARDRERERARGLFEIERIVLIMYCLGESIYFE